jgi:hypothetical protein
MNLETIKLLLTKTFFKILYTELTNFKQKIFVNSMKFKNFVLIGIGALKFKSTS